MLVNTKKEEEKKIQEMKEKKKKKMEIQCFRMISNSWQGEVLKVHAQTIGRDSQSSLFV